jgi:HAMP domain-containing protein
MPKPIKPITIEQINAMSKDEINALNAKLGRQVIFQFGTRMLVKWGLIFLAANVAKRYLEVKYPINGEVIDAGD